VPRDIIREFVCTYNGKEVFKADLHPGVGSNPLFIFYAKAYFFVANPTALPIVFS
jgi:sulfur-oxidizing protein SoxZ